MGVSSSSARHVGPPRHRAGPAFDGGSLLGRGSPLDRARTAASSPRNARRAPRRTHLPPSGPWRGDPVGPSGNPSGSSASGTGGLFSPSSALLVWGHLQGTPVGRVLVHVLVRRNSCRNAPGPAGRSGAASSPGRASWSLFNSPLRPPARKRRTKRGFGWKLTSPQAAFHARDGGHWQHREHL